jgi:hypothetical protein
MRLRTSVRAVKQGRRLPPRPPAKLYDRIVGVSGRSATNVPRPAQGADATEPAAPRYAAGPAAVTGFPAAIPHRPAGGIRLARLSRMTHRLTSWT